MSLDIIPNAADLGTEAAVHAGFPNAAADDPGGALSLDRLLVPSPHSTYFFRVRGHRFHSYGIFDGDIAVVDRARPVTPGAIVVWWTEAGELRLAKWDETGRPRTIWGILTAVIHLLPADGTMEP